MGKKKKADCKCRHARGQHAYDPGRNGQEGTVMECQVSDCKCDAFRPVKP